MSNPIGSLTISIDDGAKEVGVAVVNEHTREVILAGVIHLRQDVSRRMIQRAAFRRARRTRKTRYRQARFNRTKGEGWLPPTIRQKKDSTIRVVKDLQTLIPIQKGIVEQGQFDIAEMAAGRELAGTEYQLPLNIGRNFREKVLWRDRYTCQRCGSHDQLQAHHIKPQSEGGTHTPHNGITLCQTCHTELHKGSWALDRQPKTFIYPAHLQAGKWYLYNQLEALGLTMYRCVGWMTHNWRKGLGLEKTHVNDAIAMACRTYLPKIVCRSYIILPKRKQIWESNPTKTCTEKAGFRHWDLVKAKHRSRGVVIGSIRSLKNSVITLRTIWDDNFPVAYSRTRLLWRFQNLIYI